VSDVQAARRLSQGFNGRSFLQVQAAVARAGTPEFVPQTPK
jgi:hypothetical protein